MSMTNQIKMIKEISKRVEELQLRIEEHQNENDKQRQSWKESCEPNEDGEYYNGMGGMNEFEEDGWKEEDDHWNDGFIKGFISQKDYLEKLLNLIKDKEMK